MSTETIITPERQAVRDRIARYESFMRAVSTDDPAAIDAPDEYQDDWNILYGDLCMLLPGSQRTANEDAMIALIDYDQAMTQLLGGTDGPIYDPVFDGNFDGNADHWQLRAIDHVNDLVRLLQAYPGLPEGEA